MSMTRTLRVFDWPAAWANLFFLFCIALTPFYSALVGEQGQTRDAWRVYCAGLVATAAAQTLLCALVNRGRGRLKDGLTARRQWDFLLRAASPGVAFAVGLALTFVQAEAALNASRLCFVLIPVLMALVSALLGERTKAATAPASAS
jgi:uncharacterized membrane protein